MAPSVQVQGNGKPMSIAVIGSGVSGLGAASTLAEAGHEVHVFEKGDHLGGHAWTVPVATSDEGQSVDVDIGFQVFNQVTYPHMVEWFEKHGVVMERSDMSLAVSADDGKLEWCSHGPNGMYAQRSNLLSPSFHAMVADIVRFKSNVLDFLGQDMPDMVMTLGEFLTKHNFSQYFVEYYIIPVCASVWSCPSESCLNFPAFFILSFMKNHHLLQLTNRPQWLTVTGRSKEYVKRVSAPFAKNVHLNTEVTTVQPTRNNTVKLTDSNGKTHEFDHVLMAGHAPDILSTLGKNATRDQKDFLSAFQYQDNEVYVHKDAEYMPKRKNCWASWNFLGYGPKEEGSEGGVQVTYWLNNLQKLATEDDIFVTLNPGTKPAADKIAHYYRMAHPVPTQDSVQAMKGIDKVQGQNNIWFAGAWQGWGFHEDGLKSGLTAAHALLRDNWTPLPYNKHMELSTVQSGFRALVDNHLKQFISKGFLTMREVGGNIFSYGDLEAARAKGEPIVTLVVNDPAFYQKIALREDLGLADGYMDGDIDTSDMLEFLVLMIMNRDASQEKHGKLMTAFTSMVGRAAAVARHRYLKKNTETQTRNNIRDHYDLGNDFFELFLDQTMSYSCAIYENPTDTLYQAQLNKVNSLITKARVRSTDHVLEIGFGWGALTIGVVKKTGCRVTGITLSEEQLREATKRVEAEGLSDKIDFKLIDYRTFGKSTGAKFDRILSCEMLEAVGHEYLGDFYKHCDRLLSKDGLLVVQVITFPDNKYDEYRDNVDFIREYIFPGGLCPSLTALNNAMLNNSTFMVETVENIGHHYSKTLSEWRDRMNANKDKVLALGFDESFIRKWDYYFVYCQAGFYTRSLSTLHIVYTRTFNNNLDQASR